MSNYWKLTSEQKASKLLKAKENRQDKYANETEEERTQRLTVISAKRKAYRVKTKEHIDEYNKAWRIANEEYFKNYSKEHSQYLNAKKRERRLNDPEKYREKDRNYRSTNPEASKLRDRQERQKNRIPIVYICRNKDNRVIYVGRGIPKRLSYHKIFSSWWPEVANIKIRKRATWGDSLVLEALLIRKYQPKYNKEGVTM